MTWTPDDMERLKALRDRGTSLTWDQLSEYEDALIRADPLSRIEELEREVERLGKALVSLRRTSHDECEDGFYSCPKHPDYFGNSSRDRCYCGMDAINAIIDAALETSHD